MEFFERAHVSKHKTSVNKNIKSDENMKKQLKQMLYGFKQNDNDIIKKSVDLKTDLEDSSSVSGFSDLNITNSSIEDDLQSEQGSGSLNITDGSLSNELSVSKGSENDNDRYNSVSDHLESLTDYNEGDRSPSQDILQDMDFESSSEASSASFQTSSSKDSDELFDHDGVLAAKILAKLDKAEKAKPKKGKKRKVSEKKEFPISREEVFRGPLRPDTDDSLDYDNEHSNTSISPEDKENMNFYESKHISGSSSEEAHSNILDEDISESSGDLLEQSPPFVSITATDIPSQSLEDILGEYRYSTMKNLPSDNRHVNSTNNTGIFTSEDMKIHHIPEIKCSSPDVDPAMEESEDLENANLEDTYSSSNYIMNDDSTAYDTLLSDELSDREASTESAENGLDASISIYYGNKCCIMVLKHPTEIFIHGKVTAMALNGSIEVLGYTLKDQWSEIYATNYNYALSLKTTENENEFYGLFGKLTGSGLTVSQAEDIVTSIRTYDCVISLKPLRSTKIDFVENNFSTADLFSKTKTVDVFFKQASDFLGCTLYLNPPGNGFQVNSHWQQTLKNGYTNNSKGIVCGGKGTGKSTFLRYYINKMLAHGPILVLDLDPGQAEFTLAGNVSATVVTEPVLGPNFTHLKTPEIMYNIGMITPMDNTGRYTKAIEKLIADCSNNERLRNLPWIVNTMGMCNAMGLKLIAFTILHLKPTFLLQIDSKNVKKRYESNLYAHTIKQLYAEKYFKDRMFKGLNNVELTYLFVFVHHMDNAVKSNLSLAPKEERYLNYLAYFGELLDNKHTTLLSVVPYEISLKDLRIGSNVKLPMDAYAQVINGKIVALCQYNRGGNTSVFTLGDDPLLCFGHGLVRGVDRERDTVFVVTPARGSADCALHADWAPELRGPERDLPPGIPVPYRTAAPYNQRQLMHPPKRRFNPLQLLKMTRKNLN